MLKERLSKTAHRQWFRTDIHVETFTTRKRIILQWTPNTINQIRSQNPASTRGKDMWLQR